MGCTCSSVYKARKKIPEIAIFFPSLRIPVQSDFSRPLRGLVPKDLAAKLSSLRSQIVFVAENTGGSAISDLQQALEEYLSVLIGLPNIEYGLESLVEFKWKNLDDGRQEICVANAWFEVLFVVHMMAVLTLSEANSLLIPEYDYDPAQRIVSADCKRDAVDLLLKASGLLEFCVRGILVHLPPDIKKRLPKDLQESALEAVSIQALGQGTEIQLGLAIESQKASLSVKRRLACEQLTYFAQAHLCLSMSDSDSNHGNGKKNLQFIKWKYLEAKAAAYYYHGLVLDKGTEPSCHVSAFCCFLAAQELLSNSQKACLSFCLALPVTRIPPLWDAKKHLHQKIHEIASRKSQMYGYLLEEEKGLQILPDLPEFQLSLRPDDYELPEIHPVWDNNRWNIPNQLLKEHLHDSDDEAE